MQNVVEKIFVVGLCLFLSSCLETPESGTEGGSQVVSEPGVYDPNRTICDPFKTNSPQARDRGLIGSLHYLTADQPRYNNINDFFSNAVVADATLFLDRLFVPTRPFDRGFYLQSGQLVESIEGNTLYEYFGLRMKGQLQLAHDEPAGAYQLALLADDGALLKIPDGLGGEKIIVNNDGVHPTKFMCATEPIFLQAGEKIPMTLEYYQGPRYHIALAAMWRPWPTDESGLLVNDPLCGQQGNSKFFDSTKDPVEPKITYLELLERHWKALKNDNFFFPEQTENPCTPIEPPLVISSERYNSVTGTTMTVSWTTNVPSTSQVKITNGTIMNTRPLDSTLVLDHSVVITGLSNNTLYGVKLISTTPGGQVAETDLVARRTLRSGP